MIPQETPKRTFDLVYIKNELSKLLVNYFAPKLKPEDKAQLIYELFIAMLAKGYIIKTDDTSENPNNGEINPTSNFYFAKKLPRFYRKDADAKKEDFYKFIKDFLVESPNPKWNEIAEDKNLFSY